MLDGLACPVDGSRTGDKVDHTERADAPLVERVPEGLGSDVRAEPFMPHCDEEDAERNAEDDPFAPDVSERILAFVRASTDP